jgi:hypothetical protein
MGYRSQVTAVIYPAEPTDPLGHDEYKVYETEKYEALRFLMGTKFEQIMELESGWFGKQAKWDDENHRLVFEMQDVKWYTDYADVKAFEAMLDEVAELGYCSEIMRVGEETDDIEHRTYGEGVQYILNVERTITIG